MFDECTANWREISTLFETFFLHFGSRHLCNKNSEKMFAICIHFCRLIACEMSDEIFNSGSQMFDKLFAQYLYGKISFFAEHLFDKNSNFPQAF
jgi:hypothetical protein